jgi:hypothetical protein
MAVWLSVRSRQGNIFPPWFASQVHGFPDDIFLVSYSKSDNAWTRLLIANVVYPEKIPDFSIINHLLPGGNRPGTAG